MNNKDLLDRIVRLGIQAKNHMSTLTDSAVLKIRQQFSEQRPETVEETRVARGVIRRRKKTTDEPEGAVAPATAEQPLPEDLVATPVEAMVEAPVDLRREAGPAVESPVAPETPEVPAAVPSAPEEPLPALETVSEAVPVSPPPVAPGEDVPMAAPEPKVPETPVAQAPVPQEPVVEAASAPEPAVHAEAVFEAGPEPAVPAPPVMPPPPSAAVEIPASDLAQEGEEGEEGDEEEKAKKGKKRRRKKARKEEPARIIKLPEIIPEEPEPEEEVEIAQLASRLNVKPDEAEARDAARKKRTRPDEAEREAERKRRGVAAPPQRKEVVERQDLYSKKELAAQADRERFRDRDRRGAHREAARVEPAAQKITRRPIRIDEAITVANLAKQMGVKAGEVIKKLLLLGLAANINQALDIETATLLASEFGFEVESVGFEEEEILQVQEDRPEELRPRPPVVTVMGHVDHGKTSLLDAIRDTNVIGGEAGGITQHIGAYYVRVGNGDVVFLDTPGHEAFTSMRARGAKVTDIVILVVAADDGVMQQTIEAINHAKAAGVPIVVAVNKIDKPNANPDRVKRELAEQGVLAEDWGGDITMVEISAKKRVGIDELLEMVLLQAEILELKANPSKTARGRVIEAKLDKGRGPVATILIQEGTLRTGDSYVCGGQSGRVRNMFNDRGQRLEEAGPSMPVEVLGLSGVPNAGDDFVALTDEKQAKLVAEHRLMKLREKELTKTTKVTLESLFEQIQEGEIKELNLILKADVHGSLEAISDSLRKLSTPEVKVNLIHTATGAISESDVLLASASNAIVIGFNLRADQKVQELAEQEKVDMRYYDVIYQLLSDVRDAMEGLLEPVYQEHVLGRAEVRQTFHVPKFGTIAGCSVNDGRIERNARMRVLRDQIVVYDGKLGSLRRFKDDVKEVKSGFECGIGVENFNDIKVGDILEAYELKAVKATLSDGEKTGG
ncbi:MAG: translation initiation factor IF-2 [Syntrophobacteraceae bacterium]|nr:translation initiation factor IF-2 [Syntrophobacteraceae bacterium]